MKSVTLTKAAFDDLIFQITELTKVRDETRRMFCHLSAKHYCHFDKRSVKDIADVLGWDCYKKEETK